MDPEPKKRRKRFSLRERNELLSAWKISGMSAARFSAQARINTSNLWRWRSEADAERAASEQATRFVELRVDAPTQATRGTSQSDKPSLHFEIEGTSGLCTRVYEGADLEMLKTLISAMVGSKPC